MVPAPINTLLPSFLKVRGRPPTPHVTPQSRILRRSFLPPPPKVENLMSSSPPPPPRQPVPLRWSCCSCGMAYNLSATHRCLTCSHVFCHESVHGHNQNIIKIKPHRQRRNGRRSSRRCTIVFDSEGWVDWAAWQRETKWRKEHQHTASLNLAEEDIRHSLEREHRFWHRTHNCEADCEFPSECAATHRKLSVERRLGRRPDLLYDFDFSVPSTQPKRPIGLAGGLSMHREVPGTPKQEPDAGTNLSFAKRLENAHIQAPLIDKDLLAEFIRQDEAMQPLEMLQGEALERAKREALGAYTLPNASTFDLSQWTDSDSSDSDSDDEDSNSIELMDFELEMDGPKWDSDSSSSSSLLFSSEDDTDKKSVDSQTSSTTIEEGFGMDVDGENTNREESVDSQQSFKSRCLEALMEVDDEGDFGGQFGSKDRYLTALVN